MAGADMRPEVRADIEAKARKLGLWHLEVPQEYGGQGLNLLGLVVVWEEISRTIAVPPRGPLVFGPDLRPILFTLTPEQKEKYLFPVLRGEKRSERNEEQENYHFTERAFGTFSRAVRLPFSANPERVSAEFNNGVLTVRNPTL